MERLSDMHRNRHGFIVMDYLLSLFIVALMCPLMVVSISLLLKQKTDIQTVQDEVAIAQLQRILLLSDDYAVSENEITFVNQNRQMYASLVNHNLIIQPGTQMFLIDVDSVSFIEENGLIKCRYARKNKEYERVLVPE